MIERQINDRRKTERTTIASAIVSSINRLEGRLDIALQRLAEAEYTLAGTLETIRTERATDWAALHETKDTLKRAEFGLVAIGVVGMVIKWLMIILTPLVVGYLAFLFGRQLPFWATQIS